jgi:hypothetical protein
MTARVKQLCFTASMAVRSITGLPSDGYYVCDNTVIHNAYGNNPNLEPWVLAYYDPTTPQPAIASFHATDNQIMNVTTGALELWPTGPDPIVGLNW